MHHQGEVSINVGLENMAVHLISCILHRSLLVCARRCVSASVNIKTVSKTRCTLL